MSPFSLSSHTMRIKAIDVPRSSGYTDEGGQWIQSIENSDGDVGVGLGRHVAVAKDTVADGAPVTGP